MFFKSARLSYFILFKTLFNSTTFFSAVYSSILLPTNCKIKCTFVKMNFKKHTSILLAALILLANLGLSFVVHYCKDEIASVSFQYQEEAPCVENVKSSFPNNTNPYPVHRTCHNNRHATYIESCPYT